VIAPLYADNNLGNERAFAMVLHYVHTRCHLVGIGNSSEIFRSDSILVYGDGH
jgi:hypothetical protein